MNQDINPIELVLRDISPSQVPAVILPANASFDAVVAALVIYFGLGKQGKQAIIACPTPVTYNIPGVEHIKSTLSGGGRNLVISFPYTDGSVDKVDYRIENDRFNLIVIPREGFDKIATEQIQYSYAGGQPDTFVLVGAGNLQSLGKMYQDNQQLLDTLPLVVVNKQKPEVSFGSSEFTREGALLTELACDLLASLEIPFDQNIATIAFAGVSDLTENFSNARTTPELFELAGRMLRNGAQKRTINTPKPAARTSNNSENPQRDVVDRRKTPVDPAGSQRGGVPEVKRQPQMSQKPQPPKQNQAFNPSKPVRPERPVSTPNNRLSELPTNDFEDEATDFESTNESKAQLRPQSSHLRPDDAPIQDQYENTSDTQSETPQDWLKPKIFKGGGFI